MSISRFSLRLFCIVAILNFPSTLQAQRRADAATLPPLVYHFSAPMITAGDPYDQIALADLPLTDEPGQPRLPFQTARLLLPPGAGVSRVEVTPGDQRILPGSHHLRLGETPVPLGQSGATAKNAVDRPGDVVELSFSSRVLSGAPEVVSLRGHNILFVRLYPVAYRAATGQVAYYESLTLRVYLDAGRDDAGSLRYLQRFERDAAVGRMIENPEMLASYDQVRTAARGDVAAANPASLVSASSPFDYILITSNSLTAAFQPLVAARIGAGLQATIFDIHDILNHYAGGDDAEKLRNFISDAYTTWAATDHPLRYVALGGDDEVIPVRYLYAAAPYTSGSVLSDMYYQGLDGGTWDADGDGVYTLDDYFAEVYVGRFPVETPQEAAHMVSKLLLYEGSGLTENPNQALFLGRRLGEAMWGGDRSDQIAGQLPQFEARRLYQRDATYTTSAVIAQMTAGISMLVRVDHGGPTFSALTSSQVDALVAAQPFLYLDVSCSSAAFDQLASGAEEAIAEHYLFNPTGAFAFVGYSRPAYLGYAEPMAAAFVDVLTGTELPLAAALQQAKETLYPTLGQGPAHSFATLLLLGDPASAWFERFSKPTAMMYAPAPKYNTLFQDDMLSIQGLARAGDLGGATFSHYVLEYGYGTAPVAWTQIGQGSTPAVTQTSVLGAWQVAGLPDGRYTLRLTVYDAAGQSAQDQMVIPFAQRRDYLTGWPQSPLSGRSLSARSMAVADLDRDGRVEIVGCSPSYCQIWTASGAMLRAMPLTNNNWVSAPALADLNGDGKLEIIVGGGKNSIYAWQADGSAAPGWPKTVNYPTGQVKAVNTPAVADLDGDGLLEVVASSGYGDVYVWAGDGDVAPGWPIVTGVTAADTAPLLADLDADGDLEVVLALSDGNLYAWHHDGAPLPGWPVSRAGSVAGASSPVAGDIDDDGDLEIVIGGAGWVHAWHADGSPAAGWPVAVAASGSGASPLVESSPALGDVDGDGGLEIAVAAANRLFIWHGDGSALAGWPQMIAAEGGKNVSSPVIGDIDGDADMEILSGPESVDVEVTAWHHDGSLVAGWPKLVRRENWLRSPLLADVDQDGALEVVFGGVQAHVWVLPMADDESVEWPMFHADNRRTGVYDVAFPDVQISKRNAQDVLLRWQHKARFVVYTVWRGSLPYFQPGGAAFATIGASPWQSVDPGGLGDADNHYYLVQGQKGAGGITSSARVGVFKYGLVPGG